MNERIIDPNRYKKISRSKLTKSKNNNKNTKHKQNKQNKQKNVIIKKSKNIPTNIITKKDRSDKIKDNTLKEEKKEKAKKKLKGGFKYTRTLKIVTCIVAILIVVVISKLVFNIKDVDILSVFSNNDDNSDETLEDNYNFNIGLSKLDNTDYIKSNNVILNELVTKSMLSLVKIDKEYKIEYKLAEKIEKVSDTIYDITINPIYRTKSDDIIQSFNNIKNNPTSIYYNKLSNISAMTKIDEYNLKVNILQNDPFFVYKLTFPINKTNNKETEYLISDITQNSISLSKNNSKSTLGVIKLTNYENTDDMVADFRNGNIDMFTASSDNIMQLIGKREYNVKKYRDGETIFLLGNKESLLFKRKEVRQALAYAINREEIVKNIDMKFSEIIDIPYIYSDIKYKYDLYAAENVLLLEGWKKTGGIYNKNEGYQYKKLELNLLVNKDDMIKSQIADNIKEMVEKIGIKINVQKISENEILERLNKNEYDLILSTININENPDIEFLYNYINVSDITNSAIENVKNSDISNIEENINNLKNTISSEIACIGILAKNTNVVYQKYIKGFDNIAYMKVFDEIENIGKIKK